ncbi:MAG: hypothetical protein EZS26_000245 [Candidatus Ordinivivax streblomastigis]|uniref:DUF5063 domain-containing protein n=1 Tax=Candidatus Ordinivivax streblomastigis TaxID=2540710 RepID=A0A5M8P5Q7_9BACT|nr:MAG: hypothetical protein EZS26_000245 [Candidatus Ordinivivax streblomastigis]
MEEIVFSKYTIDFARTALEYCVFVEKVKESDKKTFVDNMTKILPLLYLKVSIIPDMEENYESDLEVKVDENFYSQVETNISELLGDDNLYLETFHPDIKLSDSPVAVKVSEDLADIYQDLGNFIAVFKNGRKETMNDSLLLCIENFRNYWGQRLVNAVRALHFIKYKSDIES